MDRALLTLLAEDAFAVLHWAMRMGMSRERQIEQVVEAFEARLAKESTEHEASK